MFGIFSQTLSHKELRNLTLTLSHGFHEFEWDGILKARSRCRSGQTRFEVHRRSDCFA